MTALLTATERIIKGYEDKRINYHYQENQGAHDAINKGIFSGKGRLYIYYQLR